MDAMNKLTLLIVLIVATGFAINFSKHAEQIDKAQANINSLTEKNKATLQALQLKEELTEHEQWLKQHLEKMLKHTAVTQQKADLTQYSLASMMGIMLLGACGFMWARSKESTAPYRANDSILEHPSDHPLAQQLIWQPIQPLAANFGSQRVIQKNPQTIRIVSSLQWVIFSFTFLLVGLNAAGFAFYKGYINGDSLNLSSTGVIFSAVGLGLLIYGFLKGWLINADKGLALSPINGQCHIDEIEALQFLSGLTGGSRRVFRFYEINLILKDGQRLPLLSLSREDDALSSAKQVADLLNVPVWYK